MSARIEIGDKVQVIFSAPGSFDGEVVSMPSQTGECWILEDSDGQIHYVQTFQEIIRIASSY